MVQSSEGFVVLKGSKVANPVVQSFQPSLIKMRQTLIDKKKLVIKNDQLILTKNHIFSSPSTAADMVMGRSANGLTEWKLRNGKTLKEVESVYKD